MALTFFSHIFTHLMKPHGERGDLRHSETSPTQDLCEQQSICSEESRSDCHPLYCKAWQFYQGFQLYSYLFSYLPKFFKAERKIKTRKWRLKHTHLCKRVLLHWFFYFLFFFFSHLCYPRSIWKSQYLWLIATEITGRQQNKCENNSACFLWYCHHVVLQLWALKWMFQDSSKRGVFQYSVWRYAKHCE